MGHVIKHGLNAFSKLHIPLPTTVGPYHTIRTRSVHTISDYLCFFGPNYGGGSSIGWTNYVGLAAPLSTTIPGTQNMTYRNGPTPFPAGGGTGVEVVPAAFSVQVTNTQSLLNAAGVSYLGRLNHSLDLQTGDTRTAQQWADTIQSYGNLKTVSNSELVGKPKQVNCLPTNMTALQNFTPLGELSPGAALVSQEGPGFEGFGPVILVNPSLAPLLVTVCVEWRVRFDPFNPMYSSGTVHPPTSPSIWHAITNAAQNAGTGVEELGGAGAAAAAYNSVGGFSGLMSKFKNFFIGAGEAIEAEAPAALLAIEDAAPFLALM